MGGNLKTSRSHQQSAQRLHFGCLTFVPGKIKMGTHISKEKKRHTCACNMVSYNDRNEKANLIHNSMRFVLFFKEDSQIFKTFGKILSEYIFFSLRSTGNRSTSGGDTLVRFRSLLVHGQAIPVVACGGWIQMMQRHHRYAGASCADNAKLPNENLPRHIFRRQFSFELRLPTLGDAVESNQKKKVHIDGEFHASRVPTKKKNPHLVQPISFHPCPHGSICVCRCCCCFIFLLYSCFDNSPLRPLRT